MKKIILAIAALGVVATAEAQYSAHSGQAHDSTTVSMSLIVDDALYLSPQAAQSLTQNYTLNDLMPGTDLPIGSVAFNVWSNRAYDVNYNVTGLHTELGQSYLSYTNINGQLLDNLDFLQGHHAINIHNVKMVMNSTANLDGQSGNGLVILPDLNHNTAGYVVFPYAPAIKNFTNAVGTGMNTNGNIITNARPAGGLAGNPTNSWAAFTLNWTLVNPQYMVTGGTYSCTVTISASQE